MAHTIRLSFGPGAAVDITRNIKRQLTALQTFCEGREEGYALSCSPLTEQGELKRNAPYTPTSIERYENGALFIQGRDDGDAELVEQQNSYAEWVANAQARATKWAIATGTSQAYDAMARGEYQLAAETYRDILDHFPPPPSAPLLQWLFHICIARTESLDSALDGLIRWFPEALDHANSNVISSVLSPAMHLLGAEITRQLTENWLMHAQTQKTATRLTKRWLNRLENDTLGQSSWSQAPHNTNHLPGCSYTCTPDGRVICAGGITADGSLSDAVWCWEIDSSGWVPFESLPEGRCDHAMVSLWDNSIVIIGGQVNSSGAESERFTQSVLSYNPELKSWETLPPLAIGRERCSAHVLRGRIVVAGGESPYQEDSFLEVWDRREHKWSRGPMLAARAKSPQLSEQRGKLLLSGSDVSISGSGLIIADLRDNSLSSANGLKGVPLSGALPLSSGDLMVWAQQDNLLNIGVWSFERQFLRWTCTDVELPATIEPVTLLPCDQDQFVILYALGNGYTGAKVATPERGLIDEIAPLNDSQCRATIELSDGRVLVIGAHSSNILT